MTRNKETFIPLETGRVKMYVCGPTVYNHIHIGNARPAIFFDTVRRYLEHQGYDVIYIQNFTDVDDKIIQAAQEEGKTAQEIAELYISAYQESTQQLGIQPATKHPKVTENIPAIIEFIQQLVTKDLAYEADGDVYYRTHKFKNYGQLSHQKTEELLQGVRIEVGEKKESAIDFTLWKASKESEISWESPWGKGRPGWHIECSAMIKEYLGETIDIHGGGIDLSFPHHENEIAQTEALTGQPLARYWMHNALLTIDDQKMSKSLGNFVRLNEVLNTYDPQIIRFFMLSGHYRSPINYSDALLQQAKNGYERLKTTLLNLTHKKSVLVEQKEDRQEDQHDTHSSTQKINEWKTRFRQAMDDDFNTANAISVLFEISKEANSYASQRLITLENIAQYEQTLVELADILGLELQEKESLLAEEIEQLIQERTQARKNKDFALSDDIRDELDSKGIVLEDTRQGVRWRRK